MSRQVISITTRAVSRIKALLQKRDRESLGIRIAVKRGGCSGFSYVIEYADESRPFEEIVEIQGVMVMVDPKALMYVIGSEMDYIEDKFHSGFIFNNPNQKAKCGCGKSFSA